MTIPSLIRAELARLTATPLARLAFIALMIVPLLYGGAYLWANRDPYAKLDQVRPRSSTRTPARPWTASASTTAKDVTKEALDGADFKWTETSAARRTLGRAQRHLRLRRDHPARLLGVARVGAGRRPEARRTRHDDGGHQLLPGVSTIAEQAGKTMRTAVAERVGKQAAKTLLVGLADVRDSLGDAVDGAGQLASGATSAADGAGNSRPGRTSCRRVRRSSRRGRPSCRRRRGSSRTGPVRSRPGRRRWRRDSRRAAAGGRRPAGADAAARRRCEAGVGQPDGVDRQDRPALQALQTARRRTPSGRDHPGRRRPRGHPDAGAAGRGRRDRAGQLQDEKTQQQLADAKAALQGLDQLRDGSQQDGRGRAARRRRTDSVERDRVRPRRGVAAVDRRVAGLGRYVEARRRRAHAVLGCVVARSGAASAASVRRRCRPGWTSSRAARRSSRRSSTRGRTKIPASTASQRNAQASVISDPVKVGDDNVAAASNYGAGLAPFFISLAAWIGMYALFLILKPISKRAITAVRKPLSVGARRLADAGALGVVQMAALFLIVRFALDLDVVHAGSTVGVMVLASATFAAIIMALNVLLGSVGQFLGLVLMLVQLVTAGGTFPWQTLPGPLAALHFALPMTYSVDSPAADDVRRVDGRGVVRRRGARVRAARRRAGVPSW